MSRIVATSDKDAFDRARDRLACDVGGIIKLIDADGKRPEGEAERVFRPEVAPPWALVRMMLPVAEALGTLIHGKKSSEEL